MLRIEIEVERGPWSPVRGADDSVLIFEKEDDARAKLAELFPVMT
jgi:hypothetical protein